MDENMRAHSVAEFDKEWSAAIGVGLELGRVFRRLADMERTLAELGAHIRVEFADTLTQAAWLSYQASIGDLVPRHPDEAPIPPLEVVA